MRRPLLLRHLAFLRRDRLLGMRIHPPSVNAQAVFRRGLRTTELVPIRHPESSEMELWDHVIAVLQYPIENVCVSDEARPVGCPDYLLDQLVDDRAFDAED